MMRRLALFDLDGTLANDEHRVPLALAGDWAGYFDPNLIFLDTVLEEGRKLVQRYQKAGYEIGYLTARRHVVRDVTEQWLNVNGFPYGRLTMKEWEETRPAANYKADYLQLMTSTGFFDEVLLFEDDPEIVRFVNETTDASATLITYYVKQKAMVKSPN